VFRKTHLESLAGLFAQVLKLCQKAGLVKLGRVALDGSKFRANASKHKAMSYGRMCGSRPPLAAIAWGIGQPLSATFFRCKPYGDLGHCGGSKLAARCREPKRGLCFRLTGWNEMR